MVGGCLTGLRGSRTGGSVVAKNYGARSQGAGKDDALHLDGRWKKTFQIWCKENVFLVD
jgi:hypothetical protein